MADTAPPAPPTPPASALAVGYRAAVWLEADGTIAELAAPAAAARARARAPLVCHAPATARRLDAEPFAALDLLELYAFVRPARFCLPTPRGLAAALGLALPRTLAAEAETLMLAARLLLRELGGHDARIDRDLGDIARVMAGAGWSWGPSVLAALRIDAAEAADRRALRGLEAWQRLAEWEDEPPERPGSVAVLPSATRKRLADMLGEGAEARPQQADYASAVTAAFQPRETEAEPRFVMAEAGTGVGKTLGYLAPATLWAEANGAAVWVSTYTRNLQHQIDGELDRLYAGPAEKRTHVVVRKGRENYLCLLNLEEAVRALAARPQAGVALGLMARWAAASRDGDMTGGDFPAWLVDMLGPARTMGLADRRGECIYAACPHYRKCFIERTVRRARTARIVVANHALVMVQAALGGMDDAWLPTRYVFDEGHHVFQAADAAFSAALTGLEARELRRWLLGAETGRGSRARGLGRRLEDLMPASEEAAELLQAALRAARALPAEGWLPRIAGGAPDGAAETFLAAARHQVLARAAGGEAYGLECDVRPAQDGLVAAAARLAGSLGRIAEPLAALRRLLLARLDDEAEELDTTTRLRIEGIGRSLTRRVEGQLAGWRAMLQGLSEEQPDRFVDWLALERSDGREVDVGMHRHWIDPTEPLARAVIERAHGVLVTSATLRDATGDAEADWAVAAARTGGAHLAAPPVRVATPSPFDYAGRTRVLVVTDVRKDDLSQVAAAYRELFRAAGGGAIGLFTAISRLRAVHGRIAAELEDAGLRLHAQHVDRLDTSTLVEIFRAEEDSCLLGTDAVRDGVDVPGRSLRLIVFDRVPWPRPDILHRARRAAFGGRRWDDMLTRLRLRQAYGRLIRRGDDAGMFVLLDPMLPSRLATAFPEGVAPRRVGLAEAVAETRGFLGGGD